MKYALVQNGEVVQAPRELPSSWKNISNLNKAKVERLKELGWLPVEVTGDESYDKSTHVKEGPEYTIEEDKVVASYTIKPKTEAELARDRQEKQQVLDRVIDTKIDDIVGKVLFALVNEIRELKGQNTLSAGQFKQYLKGLV